MKVQQSDAAEASPKQQSTDAISQCKSKAGYVNDDWCQGNCLAHPDSEDCKDACDCSGGDEKVEAVAKKVDESSLAYNIANVLARNAAAGRAAVAKVAVERAWVRAAGAQYMLIFPIFWSS